MKFATMRSIVSGFEEPAVVGHRSGDLSIPGTHRRGQLTTGDDAFGRNAGDRESTGGELSGRRVVHQEDGFTDPERGRPVLCRKRGEHVLPRSVLVRQRSQHFGLHAPNQRWEVRCGCEVDAHRHGVHERSDDQLGCRIVAPRNRRTDHHGAPVRVVAKRRRESGEQHRRTATPPHERPAHGRHQQIAGGNSNATWLPAPARAARPRVVGGQAPVAGTAVRTAWRKWSTRRDSALPVSHDRSQTA